MSLIQYFKVQNMTNRDFQINLFCKIPFLIVNLVIEPRISAWNFRVIWYGHPKTNEIPAVYDTIFLRQWALLTALATI